MARKTKSDAFDLTDAQTAKGTWDSREHFTRWLCDELDLAINARAGKAQEVRNNWDYYEQNRMRGSNAPWPDAADLPSPLAPEYTDAVHARLIQTIFVEPVWTVEGWGASAKKAPLVEEFHQRAQEDERLQNYADEWVLRGLIESVGTLEVSESIEWRRERVRKRVTLQVDEMTGQPILGEDAQPLFARNPETQAYVESTDEQEPSAEVDLDEWQPVRLGPSYDVIPFMDFGVLPAHARHRTQVWGYWKRFYRRVPELKARAKDGVYDAAAVEAIGTDDERAGRHADGPETVTVVSQEGPTAQKELFEVVLLADLDGEGERWVRVTVSKERRHLLRLKHDDGTTRYIRWMPFPKPGTVDHGYSLIGNKLITVLEEDTARRNMTADRMAMVAGTPLKRQVNALWDPYEEPFGPKSVINVRDMNEVQPMQGIPDVPTSVMAWRQHIRDDADRLIGQNDVAQGQISDEKRTLGEVQLVAGYAEVRMNVLMKRLQEPLEELFQARHHIWKRTLAAASDLPPQRALVIGQDAQGVPTQGLASDGQITAEMLEGVYWGKPRGSVETADLNRQRADFNSMLATLPPLMQMNPAIQMIFSTIPAAKALVEMMLKVNRVQDRQSFLGSEAQNVFDQLQQQQEIAQDPRMQALMQMGNAGPAALGGMPGIGAGAPQPASPEAPAGLGVM